MKKNWLKYLKENFIEINDLAQKCEIEVSNLEDFIENKYFPKPSYILKNEMSVESHIFSESEKLTTKYLFFPKSIVFWLNLFLREFRKTNAERAGSVLQESFKQFYCKELGNKGISDSNVQIEMLTNTWKHFMLGTYGVCVQDISLISNIVSKQLAALHLSVLTDDGQKKSFSEDEIKNVTDAISEYNKYTAAFAPWEYDKSSRKRLVDDIRARIL